jgi:hypothetical protein
MNLEAHTQPEALAEQHATEIVDPTTGELVDTKNVDQLIACHDRVAKKAGELYDLKKQLAHTLCALTTGDLKTRRIRGEQLCAKVEIPDDYWDQSILKEAYNSFPKFRNEFLRIESVGVRLREWKKLQGTTGPADMEAFKRMIGSANRGPSGTPKITIEK